MAKSKSVQKREKKQRLLEQKRRRNRAILRVCIGACAVLVLFSFAAARYVRVVSKKDIALSGTVLCGSYPQTMVTDEALLAELSAAELCWQYYGDCFSGTDFYATMEPTQCMKYADTEHDGEKYRAVTIERYRPQTSVSPAAAEESLQDDNGFLSGKVYWFRFEPIEWLVLDEKSGFALTKRVLDAMPFNNDVYWIDRNFDGAPDPEKELSCRETFFVPANLYKTSSVRAWLNGRFFADAFSAAERKQIKLSLHGAGEKPLRGRYGLFSLNFDRVFLPSLVSIAYDENTWEGYYSPVCEEVQRAPVTDYARCRGVFAEESENGYYSWEWLCTPGDACADVISVNTEQRMINVDRQFYYAYTVGGIRCAAYLRRVGALPTAQEGQPQ